MARGMILVDTNVVLRAAQPSHAMHAVAVAAVERLRLANEVLCLVPQVFYEAFPPQRARAIVRRLRFCHTPKHGSWLNIAENELSALTRQCVASRRFGTLAKLQTEIAAWSNDVNHTQRGVDWQMTIKDARGKLKSLYPKIRI
jgi:hypothetical protein